MLSRSAVLIATLTLGVAAPAFAADMPEVQAPVAAAAVNEGWVVTLKATGIVSPLFEGTSKYGLSGYPGLSIRRPGQPWKFGAPDDGFGFAVIDTPWLQFGPVARIRSERDSSDVKKFYGMKDIDWAVEPGAFVEIYPVDVLRIRGELRHGIGGHDGFVGNVSADYIQKFGAFTVSLGPRMELGDGDFMNEYFGVTRAEAAASKQNISAYKAKGGVKSVGASAAVTYDWNETWSTTAFGSYNRLVGEAADSPVAKDLGTKNSFTAGVGVAYSFSTDW
ncbi:MAG: MipA/OmpV family protein [Ancylobacter novellus]|uniref:MipA/OmpV family protein n=1 Tax=Ancylobacter novellus TaxID=921 RepID=A0A2W5KJJ7_ANCNO|nr:MAG: MipA/OmpV family protein [Ancylobacter novellus]